MPADLALMLFISLIIKPGHVWGGSYVGGVPLDSYAVMFFFVCGKFVRKDMVVRDFVTEVMGFTMLEKDHHSA